MVVGFMCRREKETIVLVGGVRWSLSVNRGVTGSSGAEKGNGGGHGCGSGDEGISHDDEKEDVGLHRE